ncbi:hypothetical protein KBX50_08420 [Micromonospora sp. C51]|uniref:hypothetical protein n=1 Tax=Micromonospora sp. C51 TaxID=2824879 RepID=UPI001B3841CC|nr:hypothetical protein [Micromonospora sp. C51]MBQ1048487.1 hypothetical protein [Micromonospora sp. C51]
MTPAIPTRDARQLAVALREHNLPGRRSATAIVRLRRDRNRRQQTQPTVPLRDRLALALLDRYRAEIERRGGEIAIVGDRSETPLSIEHRRDGLVLLHARGWRYYSRRHGGHMAALSYLAGMEDGWPWAVRVPGTITDVGAALDWLTPATVKAARGDGRRVRRQGDIYAIETTPAHDGRGREELPESHRWNPATRYLTHRPADGRRHRPLRVPYPVRFVRQRAYEMGRSGAWGAAD